MVDRYDDVAIIHATRRDVPPMTLSQLRGVCPTAYLKVHPSRAQDYVPNDEPLWGPPREEVIAVEHGVKYLVKPTSGLTVGLFLDMREVRHWLRSVATGLRVLNLFAYTCSLGVCAALGGAARVLNLDLSRGYLDWGKANYALNGLAVEDRDFVYGDAFDWLQRFARRDQRFDLVIVDPPSFSSKRFSVSRDYPRLAALAARVVSPDGVLLAATNHAQTSARTFDAWLDDGLVMAGRRAKTLRAWHEPSADFPVPRGAYPYLKVRALRLD